MTRNFFIFRIVLIISFLASFFTDLHAGHIVGGDMSYRCLGNGSYRIRLDIYIDCNCVNCAQFDNIASFGLYACGGNSNINCSVLGQANRLQILNIPVTNPIPVPPPELDCVDNPPSPCVTRGTYEFTVDNLPLSDASYFIMYQRCCRNVTINNILQPGGTGATFFVEITPEAQLACNNTAVFNEFPPTVICSGFPLEFDHSASDVDGDSLVYRFCAPLQGGGRDGGPDRPGLNPNSCTGIIPTPGCPPPYDDVIYRPPFSPINPMGGNPQVRIDRFTGIITGTPDLLGQFVVGVCVDEYRDGTLLNTLRRDFQFNTARCEAAVFAGIRAERVLDGRSFFVRSCGSNTVTFENESGLERFIRGYIWEFNEGLPRISNDRNATITFPDTGSYSGTMIINPGIPCSDTAEIFINIFPEIRADFEFEYDTCIAGDVQFTDLSFTGSGVMTNWDWDFDDGNNSEIRNPAHFYRIPGEFDVSLSVRDINGCEDVSTQLVRYFPVPAEVIAGPELAEYCDPAEVSFFNLSVPIDDTYEIIWDFGDGNTGSGISPTHLYASDGVYSVRVSVTSPIGCTTSASFPNAVNILPSPVADFDFSPRILSNFNKTVNFTENSSGAIIWDWDFGGEGSSNFRNPSFTFPDTGQYEVRLIVTHPSGCQDTITRLLDVVPEVRYFLPNAFTPNEDGVNDEFRGNGSIRFMTDFRMTIWSRWGEMLFETEDPSEGWNGRKDNVGRMAPPGVYVVVVNYRGPRGEMFELKGFATLVQ
jgi:gliding motility-associated-like protein